jgi:hypothetical protein
MNSEDRLRQAFEDLEQRTQRVDPRYSLQRIPRRVERRAWIPALAGAVAVMAVIGVVALAGLFTGPDTDDTAIATTPPDQTTLAPDSTTTTIEGTVTTTMPPVETSADHPTHRVVGVASDDVLDVRVEPGAGAPLVAVLPPDYAGVRRTGSIVALDDGSEWHEIELLDPTRVVDGGELDGRRLTGWVNSSFLEEYDPSLPEVPPCRHDLGSMPGPSGVAPDHVYSIRQFGLGGCIRTVVTFGQNFDTGYWPIDGITTDMRPAGIPALARHQLNGTTAFVLEGVPYAWDPQSGTHQSSVALVGRWFDGSLAIFVTIPGTTSITVADTGQMVIDVTPYGTPQYAGNGIHVLGEPVVGPGGTVEVWGLARPFEATIGTTILDESGGPAADAIVPPYVMTTDWTEAWGLFQFRASGLQPGTHLLTMVMEGGEEAIEYDVPFVVPAHTPETAVTEGDLALTDALRAFARGSGDVPPFAGTVMLSLGVDHETELGPSDADAWTVDVEEWNGYAGPFDVLGPLRGEVGITTTSVGPRPHCAGPPLEVPWSSARRLTIEPAGITSCLEWYAVSVFLNDAGQIDRVMLDLWEP